LEGEPGPVAPAAVGNHATAATIAGAQDSSSNSRKRKASNDASEILARKRDISRRSSQRFRQKKREEAKVRAGKKTLVAKQNVLLKKEHHLLQESIALVQQYIQTSEVTDQGEADKKPKARSTGGRSNASGSDRAGALAAGIAASLDAANQASLAAAAAKKEGGSPSATASASSLATGSQDSPSLHSNQSDDYGNIPEIQQQQSTASSRPSPPNPRSSPTAVARAPQVLSSSVPLAAPPAVMASYHESSPTTISSNTASSTATSSSGPVWAPVTGSFRMGTNGFSAPVTSHGSPSAAGVGVGSVAERLLLSLLVPRAPNAQPGAVTAASAGATAAVGSTGACSQGSGSSESVGTTMQAGTNTGTNRNPNAQVALLISVLTAQGAAATANNNVNEAIVRALWNANLGTAGSAAPPPVAPTPAPAASNPMTPKDRLDQLLGLQRQLANLREMEQLESNITRLQRQQRQEASAAASPITTSSRSNPLPNQGMQLRQQQPSSSASSSLNRRLGFHGCFPGISGPAAAAIVAALETPSLHLTATAVSPFPAPQVATDRRPSVGAIPPPPAPRSSSPPAGTTMQGLLRAYCELLLRRPMGQALTGEEKRLLAVIMMMEQNERERARGTATY